MTQHQSPALDILDVGALLVSAESGDAVILQSSCFIVE